MKRKYNPRIRNFTSLGSGRILSVDTRMGRHGLYPGDIVTCKSDIDPGERIVVGLGDGDLLYTQECDNGWVHRLFPHADAVKKYGLKLIKRHGQRLIDSGEMVQYEEEI